MTAIRRATVDDAPALAALRWEFRAAQDPPVEARDVFLNRCGEWMSRAIAAGRPWRAWVAVCDNRIVGQIWVNSIEKIPNPAVERERHAYVSNLFVTPAARGGVGSRLLQAALDWAGENGVDRVFLWPSKKSVTLYARNRFVKDAGVMELAISALVAVFLVAAPCSAAAQPRATAGSRVWEVEVHGGGSLESDPTTGTGALPPAGATFTTVSLLRTSRHVSSWYFGDGTSLLNDVNAGLRVTPRITALDPVLQSAAAQRGAGGAWGFRVSRRVIPKLAAELSVDFGLAKSAFTAAATNGIEASRASFAPAFTALLGTGPFTVSSITSVATVNAGSARQVRTTGAVVYELPTARRLTPYITGGAGVLSNVGDAPSVTIVGNYRFALGGVIPINETDTVTIRTVPDGKAFTGVVGGGVKYFLRPRWGIRADARVYLSSTTTRTTVDATPAAVTGSPLAVINSATSPSIQFSNNSSFIPATFSGDPIKGFTTFTTSGVSVVANVVGGVFFRF